MEKSGIKEFDELIEQYERKEIKLQELTTRLWNGGYKACKDDELKFKAL